MILGKIHPSILQRSTEQKKSLNRQTGFKHPQVTYYSSASHSSHNYYWNPTWWQERFQPSSRDQWARMDSSSEGLLNRLHVVLLSAHWPYSNHGFFFIYYWNGSLHLCMPREHYVCSFCFLRRVRNLKHEWEDHFRVCDVSLAIQHRLLCK